MDKQDIFVVFGKRLKDNNMTFEYKSRIDCLIETLNQMGYLNDSKYHNSKRQCKILFSGGNVNNSLYTEAGLGREYLQSKTGLSDNIVELDRNARNTIENMVNVLSNINEEDKLNIILRIISTDYHIKRMNDIKRLIPESGELLERIEREEIKYECLSAQYIYRNHNCPVKKWQAKLYLDSENFKIMTSNLAYVNNSNGKLLDHIVSYLPSHLETFHQDLFEFPKEHVRDNNVERILDVIPQEFLSLSGLYNLINTMPKDSKSKDFNDIFERWKKSVGVINSEVDPDEPITNGVV